MWIPPLQRVDTKIETIETPDWIFCLKMVKSSLEYPQQYPTWQWHCPQHVFFVAHLHFILKFLPKCGPLSCWIAPLAMEGRPQKLFNFCHLNDQSEQDLNYIDLLGPICRRFLLALRETYPASGHPLRLVNLTVTLRGVHFLYCECSPQCFSSSKSSMHLHSTLKEKKKIHFLCRV
jgi:hypothetical protein